VGSNLVAQLADKSLVHVGNQPTQAGLNIRVLRGNPSCPDLRSLTPYVTRVPTDGSIDLLVVLETGTDLARVMTVVQQFGINQHVPIFGGGNKEFFGGRYPQGSGGSVLP
jgi:hypothetical protein